MHLIKLTAIATAAIMSHPIYIDVDEIAAVVQVKSFETAIILKHGAATPIVSESPERVVELMEGNE